MARRQIRMRVKRTVRVERRARVTRQVRQQGSSGARAPAARTGQITSSPQRTLPAARPFVRLLREEGYGPLPEDDREYDLFVCHASEDKDFVRPLVAELEALDVRVWFDETAIRIGDSLRRSIDRGLVHSRFGVVVFSREFFAKNWTNYELDGLVAREMQGRKVILPIWHPDLTAEEMLGYSPSLSDKRALLASELSMAEIAAELTQLIATEDR